MQSPCALPAFMAATFDLDGNGWTPDTEIHAAFRLALAPDEELARGEWDYWEFQQALWRIISPRTYTKTGNVRGLWRKAFTQASHRKQGDFDGRRTKQGEHPTPPDAPESKVSEQRRGDVGV